MKKLLFTSIFCSITFLAFSQVEVKTNPIALLFGVVPVSIEKCISDNWGAEVDMLAGEGIFLVYVTGKHYLSPKRGSDGFNVGAFAGGYGGDGSAVGLGFFAGHKSVSRNNIVFELGLGIGRGLGEEEILPYAKFHVGYRFVK